MQSIGSSLFHSAYSATGLKADPMPALEVRGQAVESPQRSILDVKKSESGQRSGRQNDAQDGAAKSDTSRKKANEVGQLDLQERQQVLRLAARDREVRAHEAAHAAVGGKYAGSPSYTYTRGPDGKTYAVGGEVSISVSEVPGDPQATLEKAEVVRRAALAPAQPSAQDRQVAAKAGQMALEARAELTLENILAQKRKLEEAGKPKEAERGLSPAPPSRSSVAKGFADDDSGSVPGQLLDVMA